MKLYLLRHAEAESATTMDKARTLTGKGKRDAVHLGNVMRDRRYIPEYTLCSAAIRTRETLEALEEGLGLLSSIYVDKIYNADVNSLYETIKVQSGTPSLLIVAHNPGIPGLVGLLSGQTQTAYAPCTLSVLECPCESWADLMPGENELLDIIKTH